MTIVKHSKDLNSQASQNKLSQFLINRGQPIIISTLFGVIIGTYLDLFFVGAGFYFFPHRPFPTIFSINITFTLIGLPLLIFIFLMICSKVKKWVTPLILVLAVLMPTGEKIAESLGYFVHGSKWLHLYSFFGYLFFFILIYYIFRRFDRS